MQSKEIVIEAMTIHDYDEVLRLWLSIPELGVSPTFDTSERITAYLDRNPGLSSIASADGRIVGAALCGHDSRRGSIYHMGVAKEYRRQGIANRLVERCLVQLKAQGIDSAFLFVHDRNPDAAVFWKSIGWEIAPGISYYSHSF